MLLGSSYALGLPDVSVRPLAFIPLPMSQQVRSSSAYSRWNPSRETAIEDIDRRFLWLGRGCPYSVWRRFPLRSIGYSIVKESLIGGACGCPFVILPILPHAPICSLAVRVATGNSSNEQYLQVEVTDYHDHPIMAVGWR